MSPINNIEISDAVQATVVAINIPGSSSQQDWTWILNFR